MIFDVRPGKWILADWNRLGRCWKDYFLYQRGWFVSMECPSFRVNIGRRLMERFLFWVALGNFPGVSRWYNYFCSGLIMVHSRGCWVKKIQRVRLLGWRSLESIIWRSRIVQADSMTMRTHCLGDGVTIANTAKVTRLSTLKWKLFVSYLWQIP